MNGYGVCLSAITRITPARVLFGEGIRGKGSRFYTARIGILLREEVRGGMTVRASTRQESASYSKRVISLT